MVVRDEGVLLVLTAGVQGSGPVMKSTYSVSDGLGVNFAFAPSKFSTRNKLHYPLCLSSPPGVLRIKRDYQLNCSCTVRTAPPLCLLVHWESCLEAPFKAVTNAASVRLPPRLSFYGLL